MGRKKKHNPGEVGINPPVSYPGRSEVALRASKGKARKGLSRAAGRHLRKKRGIALHG